MRIGTRGSNLAMIQADEVRTRLLAVHRLPGEAVVVVPIATTGDRVGERPLAEIGGKGLFTKEIEEALLRGDIDVAVHSMKDMPALLPPGLVVGGVLPREDPRDALVSGTARRIAELAPGAVLGTSSVRRAAQVLRLRPDVSVVPFRGNVETRLRKLGAGAADATILALAGLNRLGIGREAAAAIEPEEMLPAVAQGAIAVEIRADDERIHALVEAINDIASAVAIAAERAFLAVLEGSCRTPIAGLATLDGGRLHLRGMVLSTDGRRSYATERRVAAGDAQAAGTDAGRELKAAAGRDLLG